VPQFDAGFVVQIDIHDDAESLLEIMMRAQGFSRIKQDGVEAVFSKQPFQPSQGRRIVVNHENGFSVWQARPQI
jgi:hypothetical protein